MLISITLLYLHKYDPFYFLFLKKKKNYGFHLFKYIPTHTEAGLLRSLCMTTQSPFYHFTLSSEIKIKLPYIFQ